MCKNILFCFLLFPFVLFSGCSLVLSGALWVLSRALWVLSGALWFSVGALGSGCSLLLSGVLWCSRGSGCSLGALLSLGPHEWVHLASEASKQIKTLSLFCLSLLVSLSLSLFLLASLSSMINALPVHLSDRFPDHHAVSHPKQGPQKRTKQLDRHL